MRPARRHGQGEDRRRGLARASSSSSTRRGRSPSCASRPASQETLDGQLDGLAERIERLPDRVLLYADDGEAAVAAAHAARACSRRRSSSADRSLEDVFLRLTGRSLVE